MSVTPLPPKRKLGIVGIPPRKETKEALSTEDRAQYEAYYAERARRKDPTQPGVAQEALDCLAYLKAEGRSSSEAFTEYGYSLSAVCRPALAEQERICSELRRKPPSAVTSALLDVRAVQAAHSIPDFVPRPEPKAEGR